MSKKGRRCRRVVNSRKRKNRVIRDRSGNQIGRRS